MEEVRDGGVVPLEDTTHADRMFWNAATFLFAGISFVKGFRWPGRWAATQAQVDYHEGFVKRGLFGATLTRVLHLNAYVRFAKVSTALLLAAVALFFWFAASSQVRRRTGSGLPVAVFAASYGLAFLAHVNGYMDVPLALLTVALLFVRRIGLRFVLAIPVAVLGLLLHEMFLLTFLPVVLLSFLVQVWSQFGERRFWLGCVLAGSLAAGAVVLTLGLALHTPLSPAASGAELSYLQSRADFPLRPDVFMVYGLSAVANFRIVESLMHVRDWRLQQLACVLLYAPFVAFFFVLNRRVIRSCDAARRGVLLLCCAAASLSPVLMNLLGFDLGRWYAMVGLMTFLVFCTLCRFLPGPPRQLSPALGRAGWVVIALGMASGGLMMDHKVIVPYPFITTGLGHSLPLLNPPAL